jgi:hypothetical protein
MSAPFGPALRPKPSAPEPAGPSPSDSRLSVLAWLAWRFLPPLDREDLRTLVRVGAACAYLAIPVTIALAAAGLTGLTTLSLLCLSVPALPPLWRNAIRLGDRRRGTALALRQVRLSRRAAALTSLSRQLAYPLLGTAFGVLLILLLQGTLRSILPSGAPLAVAVKASADGWAYAAPLSALVLTGLTALLGSERSKALARLLERVLSRPGRPEAEPQPQ